MLDSQPRGFTADEIIEAYKAVDDPISASDPKSAIRTALWSLQKDDLVYKMASGSFISTQHVVRPVPAEEA